LALPHLAGYCWADLQGLMLPHKIVVHEVDRHHMGVVLCLFREGIREPRHATVAHADIQILALYKRRRDVLRIGVAFDAMLPRARAFRRAVAALRTFLSRTVVLPFRG